MTDNARMTLAVLVVAVCFAAVGLVSITVPPFAYTQSSRTVSYTATVVVRQITAAQSASLQAQLAAILTYADPRVAVGTTFVDPYTSATVTAAAPANGYQTFTIAIETADARPRAVMAAEIKQSISGYLVYITYPGSGAAQIAGLRARSVDVK